MQSDRSRTSRNRLWMAIAATLVVLIWICGRARPYRVAADYYRILLAQKVEPYAAAATHFFTLPLHMELPTGGQCESEVAQPRWEPRPENQQQNQTIPTPSQLQSFHAQPLNFEGGPPASDFARVNGDFRGTTDQILRWGACKWGLDEDLLRAIAINESGWKQATKGDYVTSRTDCQAGNWNGWDGAGCFQSYGILQVKVQSYNAWPMARDSTAFNVDFTGSYLRACMNGDVKYHYRQTALPGYPEYGNATADQMLWGCVGGWFSGGWYDSGAVEYISKIKPILAHRQWLKPGF